MHVFIAVKLLHRSCISPLPELTYEVKQIIRDHNARYVKVSDCNPQSAIMPLSNIGESVEGNITKKFQRGVRHDFDKSFLGRDDPGFSRKGKSISYVQQCLGPMFPEKCIIRARAINMIPEIDLNYPESITKCCVQGDNGHSFQFALHLEDETATIHTIVTNNFAEKVLLKCAAREAILPEAVELRQTCLNRIKNIMEPDKLYDFEISGKIIGEIPYFFLDSIDIPQLK